MSTLLAPFEIDEIKGNIKSLYPSKIILVDGPYWHLNYDRAFIEIETFYTDNFTYLLLVLEAEGE